jgi:hypothetical protein
MRIVKSSDANTETNDAGENDVQAKRKARQKKQRREGRGERQRQRRNATALRTSWEHRGSGDDPGNILRVGRFPIRQGSRMKIGCNLQTSIQNKEGGLSCNMESSSPLPIMLGNVPGKPFPARARPFPDIKVWGGRFYNSL